MVVLLNGKGWRAPAGRKAVFVGDLVDRGPEQVRVVEPDPGALEAGTKALEASGGAGEGDTGAPAPRADTVAQNTATNNVVWYRTIPSQRRVTIPFKYVFECPAGLSIVVS